MNARLLAAVVLGLAWALPAAGGAQQVSLTTVETLIREGRAGEARSILTRWIDAVEGNAPRLDLQRAVWLRGILTVDPAQAAVDFQRLVVEFPGGGWTDQALLRLGQYAAARGDAALAARHFRTLVRDHPGSPARLQARSWLEANAEAVALAEAEAARAPASRPSEPAPAVAPTEEPARAAEPPPEEAAAAEPALTEQEPDSVVQRPDSVVQEPAPTGQEPDSVEPEPPSPAPLPPDTLGRERLARATGEAAAATPEPAPAEPVGAEGDFTVQLGAFASEARARAFMGTVSAAGFEPRLVSIPGSDLVRVRVGRFTSPETATRLYDRVVERGFEAAVVADAAREVPAGG